MKFKKEGCNGVKDWRKTPQNAWMDGAREERTGRGRGGGRKKKRRIKGRKEGREEYRGLEEGTCVRVNLQREEDMDGDIVFRSGWIGRGMVG